MSAWKQATVGEIATGFLSGGTPDTSQPGFWDGDIPWITSKWLGKSLEITDGEKLISQDAVSRSATKVVPKDSIIFATRVGVGKVGINRIDLAINQDLAGVLIDNDEHDIKFLAYQLGIDSIQQYVAMNKRGATIKGITRECLAQIRLNIPPLEEQRKISCILSTVQRAIQAQERIIQTTTELKQALMQKLFSEGLRGEPQKKTEIGLVPESWEVCTVGDVAMIQSGGTPSRENPDNWLGGTIPWVKTGEINYRTIVDTEEKITQCGLSNSSARIFSEGTLLMAMYGQGITRGRVGILGIEAATNQACAAIIPLDESRTQTGFLYYFFEYNYESLRLMGHGANQKNLSATLIKSLSLPLPPAGDQRLIFQTFSSFDERIRIARNKMSELLSLSQSLLNDLMNGTITTKQIHPTTELS